MAWIDCMRLRRVATIIRGVGWTMSGLMFVVAAGTALTSDNEHALALFGVLSAASLIVLGITHALAWVIDKRGDRVVTR
jgi:hypothetical protein